MPASTAVLDGRWVRMTRSLCHTPHPAPMVSCCHLHNLGGQNIGEGTAGHAAKDLNPPLPLPWKVAEKKWDPPPPVTPLCCCLITTIWVRWLGPLSRGAKATLPLGVSERETVVGGEKVTEKGYVGGERVTEGVEGGEGRQQSQREWEGPCLQLSCGSCFAPCHVNAPLQMWRPSNLKYKYFNTNTDNQDRKATLKLKKVVGYWQAAISLNIAFFLFIHYIRTCTSKISKKASQVHDLLKAEYKKGIKYWNKNYYPLLFKADRSNTNLGATVSWVSNYSSPLHILTESGHNVADVPFHWMTDKHLIKIWHKPIFQPFTHYFLSVGRVSIITTVEINPNQPETTSDHSYKLYFGPKHDQHT